MNIFDALKQLNDLPDTFRRGDATYAFVMSSIAAGLTVLTAANTALLNETAYGDATDGWIDVWGAMPGIARRTGEANDVYKARVQNMLLAWRDSAVAIEEWLKIVENLPNTSVLEHFPTPGYNVTVPATLSAAQLTQILADLAYVRPAGVPFNFIATTGGTYLTTVNYCSSDILALATSQAPLTNVGAEDDTQSAPIPVLIMLNADLGESEGRVTGAYLASTEKTAGLGPSALTDNQPSLLPDILLTDPTVNPSLQSGG